MNHENEGSTASVINIDPVVSGKHVGIRSSLQEQTRSASTRRRSMPAQPTGSIIMNTAVGSVIPLSNENPRRLTFSETHGSKVSPFTLAYAPVQRRMGVYTPRYGGVW